MDDEWASLSDIEKIEHFKEFLNSKNLTDYAKLMVKHILSSQHYSRIINEQKSPHS